MSYSENYRAFIKADNFAPSIVFEPGDSDIDTEVPLVFLRKGTKGTYDPEYGTFFADNGSESYPSVNFIGKSKSGKRLDY